MITQAFVEDAIRDFKALPGMTFQNAKLFDYDNALGISFSLKSSFVPPEKKFAIRTYGQVAGRIDFGPSLAESFENEFIALLGRDIVWLGRMTRRLKRPPNRDSIYRWAPKALWALGI